MEKIEVAQKLAQIGKDRHWLAKETGYSYDNLRNSLAPKAPALSFTMETKITQAFERHDAAASRQQAFIECHPSEAELEAWREAGLLDGDEFNSFAVSRINKLAESINAVADIFGCDSRCIHSLAPVAGL